MLREGQGCPRPHSKVIAKLSLKNGLWTRSQVETEWWRTVCEQGVGSTTTKKGLCFPNPGSGVGGWAGPGPMEMGGVQPYFRQCPQAGWHTWPSTMPASFRVGSVAPGPRGCPSSRVWTPAVLPEAPVTLTPQNLSHREMSKGQAGVGQRSKEEKVAPLSKPPSSPV